MELTAAVPQEVVSERSSAGSELHVHLVDQNPWQWELLVQSPQGRVVFTFFEEQ